MGNKKNEEWHQHPVPPALKDTNMYKDIQSKKMQKHFCFIMITSLCLICPNAFGVSHALQYYFAQS